MKEMYSENEMKAKEFELVILMGQNFLKTGLLITGGASIAALAYIGDSAQKTNGLNANLKYCILFFALSVLFIGIASALAYLSQHDHCCARHFIIGNSEKKKKLIRRAKIWQWGSFTCAIITFLLFSFGGIWMVSYL